MLAQVLGMVQAVILFAAMLLVGQLLVRVLSFGRHEDNAIYRLFRFLTSPVVKATRAITPAKVADRHVPFVAFFLLFWLFFALAVLIPRLARVANP